MTGEDARVIVGRYRLLGPLGRGGMGAVWHAHDTLLGRDVAIKEIWLPHVGNGPVDPADPSVQRALREAQAAARLHHPGIVTVHDVVTEAGRPWIVMERVDGRSLADAIREHGLLPERRTAEIGVQVLDALSAAHRAGVTHRDVKPANILLGLDRVVLTDFGIAAIDDATALTASGQMVGSPAYLAPERIGGEPATAASDLWGLGVTLYTAVTGTSPFQRDNTLATLAAVMSSRPTPPAHAGRLWPVLKGLLEKDPRQRLTAVQARGPLVAVAHPDNTRQPATTSARRRWWPAQPFRFLVDGLTPTVVAPPPTLAAPTVPAPVAAPAAAPDAPDPTAALAEVPHPRRSLSRLRPGWLVALAAVSLLATVTIVWLARTGPDSDTGSGSPASSTGFSGTASSPAVAAAHVPEYSYAGTLLPQRPICTAVWNPQGTHYAVASADIGLEIFDAGNVRTRTFAVPLATQGKCYLNDPGIYWDQAGTTVAVVGGSRFENTRLYFFEVSGRQTVAQLAPGQVNGNGYWDATGNAVVVKSSGRLLVVAKNGTVLRELFSAAENKPRLLWKVGVPPSGPGDTFIVNWVDARTKDSPLFEIRRYTDASLVSAVGTRSDSGMATIFTYDPASSLIAAGINDFGVEIWDVAEKRRTATLRDPSGVITDIRWSGNGQYLMVVSHGQQRVHVYRRSDWRLLGTLQPHEQTRNGVGVWAAGVANDGSVLLVPQDDRGIDTYQLD